MLYFIKSYSLQNLKNKFLILYILNVTDILATLFLLSTNLYMEANTLMIKAVESPFLSVVLKIIFPAILFIFIYYRMQKATKKQLRQSNYLIISAILLYSLINFSHITWVTILLIFNY